MWLISLIKKPTTNDFRDGFFPRKTRYKRDALILVKEVEDKGGSAKIEKIK